MSPQPTLSQLDINRLMADHSAGAQMDVVAKLSAHFNAENAQALTKDQSALATDIFRLLLNRAEVQVRSMIACSLCRSDKIPSEIARKMASDVSEVALPVIQCSQVLTDKDLLEIIQGADDEEKLIAIAKRETVSEPVSDALVDTRIEKVVSTLVQNEGAQISEKTFNKILDNHADSAVVMDAMLERGTLPISVVEKLVTQVSTTLRQSLETKCSNLVELTELRKMFGRSMEITSLTLMGLKTTDSELTKMVNHLEKKGKLQPFTALCMANMQLFEVSLARLIRIPFANVHQLLKSPNGFKALYLKAGLPESMIEAVELCMKSIITLEQRALAKDEKPNLSPFQVMDEMRQMAGKREIEGLDYMFGMMQQHTRENIRYQTGTK